MQVCSGLGRKADQIDCVVLCGGYGRRLRPLTDAMPKVLLPVAGEPCVNRIVQKLLKSSYVRTIFFLVNRKAEAPVRRYLQEYSVPRAVVVVEPPVGESQGWGSARALAFFAHSRSVGTTLVIGADNTFDFGIDEFIEFSCGSKATAIAVHRQADMCENEEYGSVCLSAEGVLLDFVEKQRTEYYDVSTACYVVRGEEMRLLPTYVQYEYLNDTMGGVVQWFHRSGIVLRAYVFECSWFDIGTRRGFIGANAHYLSGKREGDILRANVFDPVDVEARAQVVESTIGPGVHIGPGAYVCRSQIVNSVVMNDAKIVDATIRNSIVGSGSAITGELIGKIHASSGGTEGVRSEWHEDKP
jgi:glucose-1-phosphate thymidylyltransferase